MAAASSVNRLYTSPGARPSEFRPSHVGERAETVRLQLEEVVVMVEGVADIGWRGARERDLSLGPFKG